MCPKRLRHIGTTTRDLNDGTHHIPGASARAAVAGGHPQAEQPGLPQPLDGAVLQHAVALGGGVVTAQLVDDRRQPGQPVGGRTAQRFFGKHGARPDHFKRHCCLLHSAEMRNYLVRGLIAPMSSMRLVASASAANVDHVSSTSSSTLLA